MKEKANKDKNSFALQETVSVIMTTWTSVRLTRIMTKTRYITAHWEDLGAGGTTHVTGQILMVNMAT